MKPDYLSIGKELISIGRAIISNRRANLMSQRRRKLRTSLSQTFLRNQTDWMYGDICFLIELVTLIEMTKGLLFHVLITSLCRISSIPSPNPINCQLVIGKGTKTMHVLSSISTLSSRFLSHPRRLLNHGQFYNQNFDISLLNRERLANTRSTLS